jgi:hypothetical protein
MFDRLSVSLKNMFGFMEVNGFIEEHEQSDEYKASVSVVRQPSLEAELGDGVVLTLDHVAGVAGTEQRRAVTQGIQASFTFPKSVEFLAASRYGLACKI